MKEKKITIIYFDGDLGNPHTIELSRKVFRFIAVFASILFLILISSVIVATTYYVEHKKIALEQYTIGKKNEGLMPAINEMQPGIENLPVQGSNASPISIEEFKFKGGGNGTEVSFNLVKTPGDGKRVRGYMVVTGPEGYVFPKTVKIKDGKPVNYRDGDSFEIRRLKNVKVTIPFSDAKKVTIFIYSDKGELFLQGEFPIKG